MKSSFVHSTAFLVLISAVLLFSCMITFSAEAFADSSSAINGNTEFSETNSQISDSKDFIPAAVEFSDEAGAYEGREKMISLSAPENYTIYYTTDGSVPTIASIPYTDPIILTSDGNRWVDENSISQMTVSINGKIFSPMKASGELTCANIIRAAAVAPDGTAGDVITKTYFIGADLKELYNNVMVISIVTDPDNLLNYETGIMVTGKIFDDWLLSDESRITIGNDEWWEFQGNYTQKGKAWERPASIELFDGSNDLTLQQNCGIRIKGGASRVFPQRSFNIYFRESYGAKDITYQIFPNAVNDNSGETISNYKSFTLRNGGNDTEFLKFKDSWLQSRVADRAFSTQQSRIAVLFLNGEYWGHYNLLEKIDDKYIQNHYDVKEILMIKEDEIEEGKEEDFHLYEELLSFSEKDLSAEETWKEFKEIMDIRSMADYYAVQFYIGNYDWRQDNNCSLWRSTKTDLSNPWADGRWRFILYDVEYSSSLYEMEETSAEFDLFPKVIKDHPLFAAALNNPEFLNLFLDAVTEIARQNFNPEEVEKDLNEWAKVWWPYMPDYYSRFNDTSWAWESNITNIISYFRLRRPYVMSFLRENLNGFAVFAKESGKLKN